tara:strand:- start:1323 stop:3458 length:2136 start_codon:yes stop_codon:yes gene_type:complete
LNSQPVLEASNTNKPKSTILSKYLRKVAGQLSVNVRKNSLLEVINGSPSENSLDLLYDVCAQVGLAVQVTDISLLNNSDSLTALFMLTIDDELFYCDFKKNGQMSVTNLKDEMTRILNRAEVLQEFKSSKIFQFRAANEPTKNIEKRLKLLNPLYGYGGLNFFWIAVASLFANLLGLASSLFVMVVYDRVLPNQADQTLYALAIGVGIAVIFDQILKQARSNIIEKSAVSKDKHISNEIFEQFVETRGRSSVSVGSLSTIVKDFETYKEFISSAAILAIIDLPFVFVFIYVISIVGSSLYLIPLIAVPIVLVSVLVIQPILFKNSQQLSSANKARQGYLVELLTGIDVLRVNGAFAELRKRFSREALGFAKSSARAKNLGQLSGNIVYVVQQMSQVSVIVYGFHLFINQDITMGAIIATMILSGKTLAPLAKLAQTLSRANSALVARRNILTFLSQKRKNSVTDDAPFMNSTNNGIEVDNVTLRLSSGSRPILSQFTLKIKPNEKVAIIGKSGSGKSTLAKLICGLCEPEVGNVFVNGQEISSIDRSEMHFKVGVCFQEPWIFAGTIRDNIALGDSEISDEKIISSLLSAGGSSFGEDLANVLDGVCSDRGSNLSGGQKQVITLARSIVFDAPVLVLDEPTSSMDVSMEGEFISKFVADMAEKSVVLITHKPALLKICERVIVLEAGQIAWDGSINAYIELIQAQAKRKQQ